MNNKKTELIYKSNQLLKQKIEDLFNKSSGLIRLSLLMSMGIGVAIGTGLSVAFNLDLRQGGMIGAIAGFSVCAGIMRFVIGDAFVDYLIKMSGYSENPYFKKDKVITPINYKFLSISEILFSAKTQKEVFEPIIADWDEEIHEALSKDKNVKLFIINVRYIYAFLVAMWQKSPIGDLIQFVIKIAKG